jgi:chaperonin cofactor prefoldin
MSSYSHLQSASRLAELLNQAERYLAVDPAASLVKTRTFSELLARQVGAEHGLNRDDQETADDFLRRLASAGHLSNGISELFHEIRVAGNAAVHENDGTVEDARSSLQSARRLDEWYAGASRSDGLGIRFLDRSSSIPALANAGGLRRSEADELARRIRSGEDIVVHDPASAGSPRGRSAFLRPVVFAPLFFVFSILIAFAFVSKNPPIKPESANNGGLGGAPPPSTQESIEQLQQISNYQTTLAAMRLELNSALEREQASIRNKQLAEAKVRVLEQQNEAIQSELSKLKSQLSDALRGNQDHGTTLPTIRFELNNALEREQAAIREKEAAEAKVRMAEQKGEAIESELSKLKSQLSDALRRSQDLQAAPSTNSGAVRSVPNFAGIRVLYFNKEIDRGIVETVLQDNRILYESSQGENDLPTNVLTCTPDIPFENVKHLAVLLLTAGIELKGIFQPQVSGPPPRMRISLESLYSVESLRALTRNEVAAMDRCSPR